MNAYSRLPDEQTFQQRLFARNLSGRRWEMLFLSAILAGLLVLVILLFSVVNQVVGLVALKEAIPAIQLADRPLEELSELELARILHDHLSKGKLLTLVAGELLPADIERARLGTEPIGQLALAGTMVAPELADKPLTKLSAEELTSLLADNLSKDRLLQEVYQGVVGLEILQSWPLTSSLFDRVAIEQDVVNKAQGVGLLPTLDDKQRAEIRADYAAARIEWRTWLNADFLRQSMSTTPSDAGIRMAITGTVLVLLIAIIPATFIGVSAALYLEEYAKDGSLGRNKYMAWFNQFVETNIRNLAGVPSIIYGLLGLAIFARALEFITSGRFALGDAANANGRTVLSAGFTLGLLILPVIIINAQEAIRAVPPSIREASYGLGATKWQTVWLQVLPASLPGIMTGIILSVSRAIGETAPLVVVGAAVFLSKDPNGPFAPFTTLPIQIYNWASQPDAQFYNIASAAILVLLALLLSLNAAAILIRQRYSRSLQG